MANTLLTPSVIARQVLANLYENLCMVPLVYTDVSQEWAGQKIGSTVTIRKPATFVANTFDPASPSITIQNATETGVQVTLDTHKDVSFAISSADLTLRLEDFDQQFLAPAAESLAQAVDRAIIATQKAAFTQVAGDEYFPGTTTGAHDNWKHPETLIEADRLLNIANVPASDRAAVIGPTTRAQWLGTDWLKFAEHSGSTDALRQGSLGRQLLGFDTYMTQNIVQPAGSPATGQPTTEVGVAFHRTSTAFASATLALPTDNTWAAIESYKGLSLRLVKQYSMDKKSDVISLDILFGTKVLDANRGVLLRGDLA
ncbi:P22 phage major capsid protein family protein [Nocardia sp. NPDC004860]|uniref:P22 phage major capsid protein family protein n=1 Tax=Nocardia sp. NPDC004860 TaxID=3154557 RepID=UPI0033B88D22